jgi:sulfate/thiosulfate transport system substrate-binding protein
VAARGTRDVATAYLKYLYSPEAQDLAARNYYRPTDSTVASKYAAQFSKLALFTVDSVFHGWQVAQRTHFADGGIFDELYRPSVPARKAAGAAH